MFFKTPAEPKPMWTDFSSPVYVDILAKVIRNTREMEDGDARAVVMSEMLPSFGDLWLPDAEGRRYTSEFRLLFVDQARTPTATDRRPWWRRWLTRFAE